MKLRLVMLKILLYSAIWGSFWQLDLICAPLVWSLKPPRDIFLLPFNIPIHVTIAYCLFYAILIISTILLMILTFYPYAKEVYRVLSKHLNRRH